MSISSLNRRPADAPRRQAAFDSYVLPPTVSRPALLSDGTDAAFRTLVANLLTISARMEMVRSHLGERMSVSAPQYSQVIAVAHFQGERGVSVSALARASHVSPAFVASESGKLARRRLLTKRTNPRDARGMLISISPAGRMAIDRISEEIRAVNDLFFGALDAASFASLSEAIGRLIDGSSEAIRYIGAANGKPHALRKSG